MSIRGTKQMKKKTQKERKSFFVKILESSVLLFAKSALEIQL